MLTVIEHLQQMKEASIEEVAIDFQTDVEVISAALEFIQFLGSLINGTLEGPDEADTEA